MSDEKKHNSEADHEDVEKLQGERRKVEESHSAITNHASLKVLAEQMGEAAKRDRTAFFIFLLIGLLLAIAVYNYRGSWLYTHEYRAHEINRNMELKDPINPDYYPNKEEALIQAINRESENDKPDYRRHLLHDVWDGTFKTVDVPVLGVEFYIEDLPLIGGIGLALALFWFYYTRKREFSIIKKIAEKVKDAHTKNQVNNTSEFNPVIEYFYNSVAYSQVFNKIKGIDKENSFIHRFYLWIGLFFPSIMLIVVIGFDVAETFRPIENQWIPKQSFYDICKLGNDWAEIDHDENWTINDKYTWKENKVDRAWDSVQQIIHSQHANELELLSRESDTGSAYFIRMDIKAIVHQIQDSTDYYRHSYFKHPNFIQYLQFHNYTFYNMRKNFLRLIPFGIIYDLALFHFLFPLMLLFNCIYLSRKIFLKSKERDEQFNIIESCFAKCENKIQIFSNDFKINNH